MADNIITHPITNGKLMLGGKEGTILGAQKVIVGVENPDRREVLVNKETGLNYSRTAVEAQEIYNLHTKKHSPWFILDLETGQHGWYPGCIIRGDLKEGITAEIKAAPNDTAETLETISNASVEILEIDTVDQEPYVSGWHKVIFTQEGYIKQSFLTNLRYTDPSGI